MFPLTHLGLPNRFTLELNLEPIVRILEQALSPPLQLTQLPATLLSVNPSICQPANLFLVFLCLADDLVFAVFSVVNTEAVKDQSKNNDSDHPD